MTIPEDSPGPCYDPLVPFDDTGKTRDLFSLEIGFPNNGIVAYKPSKLILDNALKNQNECIKGLQDM